MNTPTPTPTPRTDAATYPADCLGTTLVTNRDFPRALEAELVTLTGAYTCANHNDQQRASCPVCLVVTLTTERDQLLSDAASQRLHGGLIFRLTADRARLDWLEDSSRCYHVCIDRQPDGYSILNMMPSTGSVRSAIDAAMKECPK